MDDREPQPQPFGAFARRVVHLMELLENRLTMFFGNAGASVPDFDTHCVAAPTAAEQHFSLRGEFHGVGQKVAQDLLEQTWIAPHHASARRDAPVEPLRAHVIAEILVEMFKQLVERKVFHIGVDDARFELIDVEQRVQHSRHHAHRGVETFQEFLRFVAGRLYCQQAMQQPDGLQWLPQIMARGGEEARFRDIGPVGDLLGVGQRLRRAFVFGDVPEGDDHAFDAAVLVSVRQNEPIVPNPVPRRDFFFDRRLIIENSARRRRSNHCRPRARRNRREGGRYPGRAPETATWRQA